MPAAKKQAKRVFDVAFGPERIYESIPLKEVNNIRLLRLHAGSSDDLLEGNLIIAENHERYEALSYTWGLQDQKSFIRILSEGNAHKMEITPNLKAALRELRDPDQARLLWIDALCINQEDDKEKSAQVPKMAGIYTRAFNVCIWLGEEKDNSDLALSFIKRMLNLDDFDRLVRDENSDKEWAALFDLMRRSWFTRRWVVQEIALARKATIHCGEQVLPWREFRDAVSLFVSRYADLKKLFQGSKRYNHHPDYLGDITALGANRLCQQASNVFRRADEGGIQAPLMSLEALVSNLSAFEATEPRDVIYSVLALAEDTKHSTTSMSTQMPPPSTPIAMTPIGDSSVTAFFPGYDPDGPALAVPSVQRRNSAATSSRGRAETASSGDNIKFASEKQKKNANLFVTNLKARVEDRSYEVDYDKSFYEVFIYFLNFTFKRSRSLDIICRPWAPAGIQPALPSWIPTLDNAAFRANSRGVYSRVRADPLVGMPHLGKPTYSAARTYPARWRFGENAEVHNLFVDGFVLDTVVRKELPAQEGNVPYTWLGTGGWRGAVGPAPDRYWRTLVADRSPDGLNPPSTYQRACEYAYHLGPEGGDLNTERHIMNNCPAIVAEFLRRVQCVVWKRVLISTQCGFLGLAPEKAEIGDLVCILYGCTVPVALRKVVRDHGTGDYHYQFIGECYIHGMMDGQAFQNRTTDEATHFELR